MVTTLSESLTARSNMPTAYQLRKDANYGY